MFHWYILSITWSTYLLIKDESLKLPTVAPIDDFKNTYKSIEKLEQKVREFENKFLVSSSLN